MLDLNARIAKAARELGFLDARAATAQPFDFWRKTAASLPIGKSLARLKHDPSELGWPEGETTVWVAAMPTPPFERWPEGYGEISHYYTLSPGARKKEHAWAEAVREMGVETLCGVPLPYRAAAIRAGLGIAGLFGPLITSGHGSFVSICLILAHVPPPAGAGNAASDAGTMCRRCGACRKACPVGAITSIGLDATLCLRYDIGNQHATPQSHYEPMGTRIIGCEDCQKACPCNSGVTPVAIPENVKASMKLEALLTAPDMVALSALIGSNYARKKHIQTQAVLAAANTGRKDLLAAIESLADDDYAPLAAASRWAASRLCEL